MIKLKFDKEENTDAVIVAELPGNKFLMASQYARAVSFWIADKDGQEIESIGRFGQRLAK